MFHRIGSAIALAGLLAFSTAGTARAEGPAPQSGWSFEVAPYVWLPTINTTLQYPVPGGGTATTAMSLGPGDYIPKLNFGAMLAGEARYDRFSVLTDILYLNANATSSQIKSFDFNPLGGQVSRVLSTSSSVRLQSTIWTLAGGYTVAEGAWGNVDLIAGTRLLAVDATTNFSLGVNITRPNGSIALGRIGGLSASKSFWNGIGGIRGRFNIADVDWFGGGKIFLPYYFDIGGGGSSPTWQIFAGAGLQTNRVAVSIGYRYLSFQQGNDAVIQKLNLGGPILVTSIRF